MVLHVFENGQYLLRALIDLPAVPGQFMDRVDAVRVNDDVVGLEKLDAILDRVRTLPRCLDARIPVSLQKGDCVGTWGVGGDRP
jgi:hypothetical protein